MQGHLHLHTYCRESIIHTTSKQSTLNDSPLENKIMLTCNACKDALEEKKASIFSNEHLPSFSNIVNLKRNVCESRDMHDQPTEKPWFFPALPEALSTGYTSAKHHSNSEEEELLSFAKHKIYRDPLSTWIKCNRIMTSKTNLIQILLSYHLA